MQQTSTKTVKEIPIDPAIFQLRTANEWMRKERKVRTPKALFGECWREGELAILFADAGAGKSLLAMQIGEMIARGSRHSAADDLPFKSETPARDVLYMDFEHSGKQFQMRYTAEGAGKEMYDFSDRLHRVGVTLPAAVPEGFRTQEEYLHALMETLLRETGAKVLIIDNISHLRRTVNGGVDLLEVMRRLRWMKKDHGLSVLVLAHATGRSRHRTIELGDLVGARSLGSFADSIFAIGRCAASRTHRYVKLVKSRSSSGSDSVPAFRIKRLESGFLGFVLDKWGSEAAHLNNAPELDEDEIIDIVADMVAKGFSVRAIAAELGMSRSAVHRYSQKAWTEPVATREPFDPTKHPGYFPGCEEYDAELSDPRFEGMFGSDEGSRLLAREGFLIESARAEAKREYERTGSAPSLEENEKYTAFMRELDALRPIGEPEAPHASGEEAVSSEGSAPADAIPRCRVPLPQRRHPHYAIQEINNDPRHPDLALVIDEYGKELFVEEFAEDGRPRVWYTYRKRDRGGFVKTRWVQGTWGPTGTHVPDDS